MAVVGEVYSWEVSGVFYYDLLNLLGSGAREGGEATISSLLQR